MPNAYTLTEKVIGAQFQLLPSVKGVCFDCLAQTGHVQHLSNLVHLEYSDTYCSFPEHVPTQNEFCCCPGGDVEDYPVNNRPAGRHTHTTATQFSSFKPLIVACLTIPVSLLADNNEH